jgi:hypothetical protein
LPHVRGHLEKRVTSKQQQYHHQRYQHVFFHL